MRVLVHRSRFVPYVPSAVNALALYEGDAERGEPARLACVRANGDVEIWDPVSWVLERTIAGVCGAGSTESAVWVRAGAGPPVLVCGGLDGTVRVVLAESGVLSSSSSSSSSVGVGGGGVWALAACGWKEDEEEENEESALVAAGCEDGGVRVVAVGAASLQVVAKVLRGRAAARVLAVAAFAPLRRIAAAAADAAIHVFDARAAVRIARISLDSPFPATLPRRAKTSSSSSSSNSNNRHRPSTIVWAVQFLPDGSIVSGDSLGAVCFWHPTSLALVKSIKAHHADVLCLAVGATSQPAPDSSHALTHPVVFSSGVDRRVLQYRLVDNSATLQQNYMQRRSAKEDAAAAAADKTWVLSSDRRFHSHDVRALAFSGVSPINALVSAGVDASLIVSHQPQHHLQPPSNERKARTANKNHRKSQTRVGMFPQKSIITLADDARLVLARFDTFLKLWQLGEAVAGASDLDSEISLKDGERVNIVKKERLLAEIKIKCETNLVASAISPDGTLIAASDMHATRLFRVSFVPTARQPTKIARVKSFPSPDLLPGSTTLTFSSDSKSLVLAGTDSVVRIVDVSAAALPTTTGDSFGVLGEFYEHARGLSSSGAQGFDRRGARQQAPNHNTEVFQRDSVASLVMSRDGQWLATGDLSNRIFVYNLDNMKLHTVIPKYKALHTALAFISSTVATLAVALSSNEVYLYDLEHRAARPKHGGGSASGAGTARLTEWSRQNSHLLPARVFRGRRDFILGISAAPARGNGEKLVVWGHEFVCSIDLSVPLKTRTRAKRKKLASLDDDGTKPLEKVTDEDEDDENENDSEADAPAHAASADTPTPAPALAAAPQPVEPSFSMHTDYGPLMHFGFLSCGEAVVVERPILSVMDSLPPSFYRKTYGT